MPDPVNAPPTPPPAAPTAPVAAPKPAPAAAAPKPAAARVPSTPPAKPNIRPPERTNQPARKALGAKKALGLDETPRQSSAALSKAATEKNKSTEYVAPAPAAPAPVGEVPAAPAIVAPDPVEVPAAPVIPATPAKIKVGDKEYTAEELETALKAATPPATAAPVRQEAPAPAAPPELSAEEIAEREAAFVEENAATFAVPLTEAEMDTVLAGGKEAVTTMTALLQKVGARAIMEARKGVAVNLNPILKRIDGALQPLLAEQQKITEYTVGQQFLAKHKDFVPHAQTAKSVAEELLRLYPTQVAKMNTDQFVDEVARQTDIILTNEHKRWFPAGNGNWRVAAATPPLANQLSAQPVAVPPVNMAIAVPPGNVAAAPPVPAAPRVRPPAVNVPAGAGTGAGTPWNKTVAGSLRG